MGNRDVIPRKTKSAFKIISGNNNIFVMTPREDAYVWSVSLLFDLLHTFHRGITIRFDSLH